MSSDERPNDDLPDEAPDARGGPAPSAFPAGGAMNESAGEVRPASRWWRWLVPVTAAGAILAVTAGTAMALRIQSPQSGDSPLHSAGDGPAAGGGVAGVTGGIEPGNRVVDPTQPSGPDVPVSNGRPGAQPVLPTLPADPAEPTAGRAMPAPPRADPGRTESEPPWPRDGRPMTGTWAETGPDGQALTLHFYGTPATPKACGARYTATVWETPERVLLRVHEHRLDRGGGSAGQPVACPEVAAERKVTVELDRRLGDRSVHELPERREVPVRDR